MVQKNSQECWTCSLKYAFLEGLILVIKLNDISLAKGLPKIRQQNVHNSCVLSIETGRVSFFACVDEFTRANKKFLAFIARHVLPKTQTFPKDQEKQKKKRFDQQILNRPSLTRSCLAGRKCNVCVEQFV